MKTYSPNWASVHVQLKLTPAPPAGTFATNGVGPGQTAIPPVTSRSDGETLLTATLLLTFSVTVSVPPWMTKLVLTDIAVFNAGGPAAPGIAAIGAYGPYVPRWPIAVGGAVDQPGKGRSPRRSPGAQRCPTSG